MGEAIMDRDEFLSKINAYIGGPEHNAYYDVKQILEKCVDEMFGEQRESVYDYVCKNMQFVNPIVTSPKMKPNRKIPKNAKPYPIEVKDENGNKIGEQG